MAEKRFQRLTSAASLAACHLPLVGKAHETANISWFSPQGEGAGPKKANQPFHRCMKPKPAGFFPFCRRKAAKSATHSHILALRGGVIFRDGVPPDSSMFGGCSQSLPEDKFFPASVALPMSFNLSKGNASEKTGHARKSPNAAIPSHCKKQSFFHNSQSLERREKKL